MAKKKKKKKELLLKHVDGKWKDPAALCPSHGSKRWRGLIPPHPWAGCSEERVGSVSRPRGTVLLTQHSTPRSVTYKLPHACVICLQGFLWWQRLESDCPHGGILNSLKEDWGFLMEKWSMFIVKRKKQGVGSVQKGECVCPYTCECTWPVCAKSWRWGRITHIASWSGSREHGRGVPSGMLYLWNVKPCQCI